MIHILMQELLKQQKENLVLISGLIQLHCPQALNI
jgi:hypothetical protein